MTTSLISENFQALQHFIQVTECETFQSNWSEENIQVSKKTKHNPWNLIEVSENISLSMFIFGLTSLKPWWLVIVIFGMTLNSL